jgi:hypothetical protein
MLHSQYTYLENHQFLTRQVNKFSSYKEMAIYFICFQLPSSLYIPVSQLSQRYTLLGLGSTPDYIQLAMNSFPEIAVAVSPRVPCKFSRVPCVEPCVPAVCSLCKGPTFTSPQAQRSYPLQALVSAVVCF